MGDIHFCPFICYALEFRLYLFVLNLESSDGVRYKISPTYTRDGNRRQTYLRERRSKDSDDFAHFRVGLAYKHF